MSIAEPPVLDFELLFSLLPTPHAVLAPDGTLLALNAALVALMGPAAPGPGQPAEALRFGLVAGGSQMASAAAWAGALAQAATGVGAVLAPEYADDAPGLGYWELTFRPVPAAAGGLGYVLLRLLDVGEQLRSQARLLAQQQRTQRILDNLPLTISTVEGPELTFTFLSAQAQQAMGGRAAVGRTVAESLPEIAAQGYTQLLAQVRDTGKPHLGHEEHSQMLDPASGELHDCYHDFGFVPLRGADGAAIGVLAYGLNVTERVQARLEAGAARGEAEAADQRLCRRLEALPIITFSTDAHGRTTYMSPQWYAYTGQVPGGPWAEVDAHWSEAVHPDDAARSVQEISGSIADARLGRVELRLRDADGHYRWFLTEAVPELNEAGHLQQRHGYLLDVEELRGAQRRLEDKDRQLTQILNQSPALISAVAGSEHRFAFTNAGYDEAFGRRVQLGRPVAECYPEAAEQGFVALLDQVYRTGETVVSHEAPFEMAGSAGEPSRPRYFDVSYQALRDEQERVSGILTFALDVTERVQSRQRLDELEQQVQRRDLQLRLLTESLPQLTFIVDAQVHLEYLSPQWYAYTGQAPDADVSGTWTEWIHPDDLLRIGPQFLRALAEGTGWNYELRLRRHDGEYRWFLSQGVAEVPAVAGEPVRRWYGANTDVEDVRRVQQELERSREDFAALADNIAQLAWMANATGHIFWYNRQWYDYTGLNLAAMQGWGWMQVHDPALAEGVNARYLACIQAGEPWEDTFPLRRHDGEFRWFLSRARPIRDAGGAITRWFGTNTDVTELRELQLQLRAGEEELRIQAESLPQQIWTALPDGTVDFYNQRTAAYLGEAMEKNGAAHWLSFVHPDDRAPMQIRWEAATASQRYYEAEFRLRRYDGQYRWFLGQAQARRAPGGQVLKWYGTNTDVHQQRALQEQVLASQARFQQLLETLPQMTWTTRADGYATYYSQRWYDYTGANSEDMQGWGWETLVHPDDLAGTMRKWRHSLATGEPFEDETRWRDRHGHYRWFLIRAEAIRDKTGAISLWVGAHTDVHEVKQAQAQLEAQNARLVRSNEDLDNFVYTASHDLKQPINNMAGIFGELTRTAYFRDPDASKLVAYFERALAQIYATIDDLGAIVQGQRQQQEVPAEDVPLASLLAEVIASLQDQVSRLGATFDLDLATCPSVRFVRPNLQSVLSNLFGNALKYAAPGRPPHVRFSSAPDAATGRPVLTVQDNGLGIDLERYRPQLFQLFRRFHAHTEGTGMGLYLVNRIVQGHGGRLEMDSAVDEGTTFRIYL